VDGRDLNKISVKTAVGFLTTSALVVSMSAGALAAGHSETVIAFDPEAFQFSEGVAVDADGNVYASLSPLGQLVRVAPGAGVAETVGSVEGIADGEPGLIGLAVGPDGAVYGALTSQNPDANGVWRFDPATGAAERVAGTEAIGFPNEPSFGDDSTMYVTDTTGGTVWRVPEGGSAESWIQDPLLEGTGEAGLGFPLGPNGIEVVGDTVYVGVTETAQIVAIPINDDGTAGTPTTFAQHDSPIDGVDVDAAGNVYTTHPFAYEVRRVNADGDIEVIANLDDSLDGPTSVAIGPGAEGETAYIANYTGVPLGGELGAGPGIVSVPTGGE
jgi:sugar lactone lactonase YvrE